MNSYVTPDSHKWQMVNFMTGLVVMFSGLIVGTIALHFLLFQ
jgi:hypothetical protein